MENLTTNKVTEGNIRTLYDLVAMFARKDWAQVNLDKSGRRKYRKNGLPADRPYSLSMDTEVALGVYTLALRDDLTLEQVAHVKAYLLLQRKYGNI